MKRYIEQLIEDLNEAKKRIPDEIKFSEDYEEFEEQMLSVENSPDITMEALFGISMIQLPPADKLTEEQMQLLTEAILDTWAAFSLSADFPGDLPIKLQYELLRGQFEEKIHYMPGWTHHFNFCIIDCETCLINEYCDMKEDLNNVDDDMESIENWENPF
jgi:hypothetical protein